MGPLLRPQAPLRSLQLQPFMYLSVCLCLFLSLFTEEETSVAQGKLKVAKSCYSVWVYAPVI